MNKILYLLIPICGVFLYACEGCEECNRTPSPPYAQFMFIDGKSLDSYNDTLNAHNQGLNSYNEEKSEIDSQIAKYNEEYEEVLLKLDSGYTEYREDSISLANEIKALSIKNELLQTGIDSLETLISEVGVVIDIIESGDILLQQVTNLRTGFDTVFSDSATSYYFPLDVKDTLIDYTFRILENTYQVSLSYELQEELSVRQEIYFSGSQLDIIRTTFDSLIFVSESDNNTIDETITYCYF